MALDTGVWLRFSFTESPLRTVAAMVLLNAGSPVLFMPRVRFMMNVCLYDYLPAVFLPAGG